MKCLPVAVFVATLLFLASGCSTSKSDDPATPVPQPGITADFSADPTEGNAPLTVQFTDLSSSTLGVATWSWDFGDGGTSTERNPMHGYVAEGSYTVSLAVTGPAGSDAETKTDYISVSAPAGDIAAGFIASPTYGVKPLTVQFTDISTSASGITSWSWDFGDAGTSTETSPQHEYATEGLYTVSLTVSGLDGESTETKPNFIQVYATGEITANFFASPPSGDEPLTVWFTDTSTATSGVDTWYWDFGDGGTGTTQFPQHIFKYPGTYTVSLTVTGLDGSDTKTAPDYIEVLYVQGNAPELNISQWVQGGPYTIAGLRGKVVFLDFTSPST
jgi:PKD repeat protein